MREQLIEEINSIESERFLQFILSTIKAFKQKWGVR